ncbi:MAG: hypothetical protein P8171_25435 [Candidatus Thiodiazotropha sp.]
MGENKNINLSDFLNQQYLCEAMTTREIQTLLEFTEEVQFQKNGWSTVPMPEWGCPL